jgi:shikimate kinase
MAPRNVVLIGFMGAGKSAVGRALAERLGFTLYDTDAIVEDASGKPISELWDTEGEEGFRAREHDAVLQACAGSGRVIASGGGAVLEIRNYGILKGAGTVVYLRAPADVLRARVGIALDRPLLRDPGAFDRLLAERTPAYEAAAHLIVDTDERTPEEVAADIEGQLE